MLERARKNDAILLGLVLAGVIVHEYLGWRAAGYVAAPSLIAYIALEWPRLRANARILLFVCAGLGLVAALRSGARPVVDGMVKACFYPAFLAALGSLRDAAASSAMIDRGGRYLVNQPPGRRYLALTLGGHIFGILLNMGGLALIASMLKQVNTLESAGGDARRLAIREQRITLAVLRGFSTMPMWSPLSITMALLFSLTPQAHWGEYVPYGLGLTIIYLGLGWLFDTLQFPRATTKMTISDPYGWVSIVVMLAQVGVMTAIALTLEKKTGIGFITHLLVVVPLFALGWLVVQNASLGFVRAFAAASRQIAQRSALGFPTYANEVALFATSGFLGAMLSLLVPPETLPKFLASLHLSVDALTVVIVLVVGALGFVGVNPMITLTLILGSLASSPIEGLSPLKLVITAAGAWTLSLGLSPLNGSMVLLANVMGVPSETIALKWNGVFAVLTLAAFCVAIYYAPF
ncbi:MAG: hypothetical protein U1E28_09375 [Beijerinckiaceae bacterium]